MVLDELIKNVRTFFTEFRDVEVGRREACSGRACRAQPHDREASQRVLRAPNDGMNCGRVEVVMDLDVAGDSRPRSAGLVGAELNGAAPLRRLDSDISGLTSKARLRHEHPSARGVILLVE